MNAQGLANVLALEARKDVAFRAMLEALKRARAELNMNSMGYKAAREQVESAIKLGEQVIEP